MEGQQGTCPFSAATRGYAWLAGTLNLLQPVFLLLVRVYIGYQAAVSGWGHLHNIRDFTDELKGWNVPMPHLNAYVAGTTELVGGTLLAVGFLSRLVAIPFSFNFLIAILSVNLADPKYRKMLFDLWDGQDVILKDTAFPFLVVGIIVLIFGPGLFSVDGLLKWLFCRKPAAAPDAASV